MFPVSSQSPQSLHSFDVMEDFFRYKNLISKTLIEVIQKSNFCLLYRKKQEMLEFGLCLCSDDLFQIIFEVKEENNLQKITKNFLQLAEISKKIKSGFFLFLRILPSSYKKYFENIKPALLNVEQKDVDNWLAEY